MLDTIEIPARPDATAPRRSLSHVDALLHGLRGHPPTRKRDRTRARLLAATAQVLEEHGFDGLRVADIAKAAAISPAAFYVYFSDRNDAAERVLSRFADRLYALDAPTQAGPGAEVLHAAVRTQLAVARANRGLLRALGQAEDASQALAALTDRLRGRWIRWAAALLLGPEGAAGQEGAIEALEDMMMGALRRLSAAPATAAEVETTATALVRVWTAALTPAVRRAAAA